ncbi:DUF3592 domain-containing protein [Sedimentibacter hydroxybenzoicus DSM 7310]|uniref:DUF3592 domain-containing protein n=1 Tax=Sedimentibacter hydroxybenzoicus DSM 7310 TaxID=1123245 RepID=A0A974BJ90_SEDHY|nr:DUF3592 domain-containing protein [Sedimentibacter hydroxybenzoicus]NYB73655.1 DUF3592 domain-containing protein [Sedimentibacter hydroxybenzoicus DSM 7310]
MEYDILVVFGAGVVLVIAGLIWLKKIKGRKTVCTSSCTGKVERVNTSVSRDDDGDTVMYSPVFSYEVNGTAYTHESSIKSSDTKYRRGEAVTIFYNPEAPAQCYVKGNNDNVFLAFVILGMGVLAIVMAAINFFD